MTDFSNYSEDAITNWALGKASMPATTTRYLAAFTAVTDAEAGTGTEVSGGSYARVAVTTLMGTTSGGAITNTSAVEFAQATANWGNIVAVGLFDAATAGNAISALKTITTVTINTDDILRFPVGDLDFATQ